VLQQEFTFTPQKSGNVSPELQGHFCLLVFVTQNKEYLAATASKNQSSPSAVEDKPRSY
jgi:hypothetical protein